MTIRSFCLKLGIPAILLSAQPSHAVVKISIASGSWGTSGIWSPSGVPATNDDVIIAAGHTVNVNNNYSIVNVTVNAGGTLTFTSGRTLTMTGHLTVNGTCTMAGGNITFASGKNFVIGSGGSFTWDPGTNTAAAATLFTNGIENFAPSSTLIIKKWYNFSVPLASVVSGNFGNLELNSLSGSFLYEWNQNNLFQTKTILGELSVDQGWIVLDKSSSISSTTIGSIRLKNANSYLDLHGGTHHSSFTVSTGSITINAGMLNGIYNGNGNVSIQVSGNVTNSGYFYGIYNSGVSGVGNGNFTLNVNGSFTQTTGDFRGNYNLTTFNSGISTITLGSLSHSGGIWMGQYGCHVAGSTCTISVAGNVDINFTSSSQIFRGVGLSLLSSTFNTPKFSFTIGGNLTISGNTSGEWVSNASNNEETTAIAGNLTVSGGNNRFNFGATGINHPTTISINGNLTVSNGSLFLSAFGNSSAVTVGGNVSVTGGTLSHKGGNGPMTTTINGSFTQTGGSMLLYNNTTAHSTSPVTVNITGDFNQSGGTINFNNNTHTASAEHIINLYGQNYSISGSAGMTHANAGTGPVFGRLNFARTGTLIFSRSGSHNIQQIKQNIKSGNTLLVNSGNIQVASHSSSAQNSLFRVEGGGVLTLGSAQMASNGQQSHSSVYVENGGLITLTRSQGLYDGTSNASIVSTGNMTYYLEPSSTVEYNGTDNQIITGIGTGTATTSQQKYGILRINFSGTPDAEYVYPVSSLVYVRNRLELVQGEFFLNNHKITIESGNPTAVQRTTGYIKSETNAAINNGIIRWENISSGTYEFPFGVNSTQYIPVILTPSSGSGFAEVSTRRTLMTNNTPWTGLSHVSAVTNMYKDWVDVSVENVIDRWWVIYAPGITGSLTLSYTGDENTTDPSLRTGLFSIQSWNGTEWLPPQGSGPGITSGIGTVTATGFSNFNPLVLSSQPAPLPVQLLSFTAVRNNMLVNLEWKTASEKNNDYFSVERSGDGKKFESIGRVKGAGTTSVMQLYRFTDENPLPGTSYYRLRQIDFDGKFSFSQLAKVDFGGSEASNEIEILTVAPNPFADYFYTDFNLGYDGETLIRLLDSKGKTIYSEKNFRNAGMNQFEFREGASLPRGTYFLIINQGEYRTSKKLIK